MLIEKLIVLEAFFLEAKITDIDSPCMQILCNPDSVTSQLYNYDLILQCADFGLKLPPNRLIFISSVVGVLGFVSF